MLDVFWFSPVKVAWHLWFVDIFVSEFVCHALPTCNKRIKFHTRTRCEWMTWHCLAFKRVYRYMVYFHWWMVLILATGYQQFAKFTFCSALFFIFPVSLSPLHWKEIVIKLWTLDGIYIYWPAINVPPREHIFRPSWYSDIRAFFVGAARSVWPRPFCCCCCCSIIVIVHHMVTSKQ